MGEFAVSIQPTSGEKFTVTVNDDQLVGQLKSDLSGRLSCPVNQQRLIHRGRILQDSQSLSSYGITANHTIHFVRGTAPTSSNTPASTTSSMTGSSTSGAPSFPSPTQQTPFGMPGGMEGFPDIQRMQEQLMANPEMMANVMQSPMMQALLDNPDALSAAMSANPMMQQLLEQNPQLNHIFSDPALMRQTLEAARNPAAMREMMRSHDLALSQLENHPEGFNALRRMYHEVQEPLMEATLAGNQSGTAQPPAQPTANTPDTGAVPNPWAARTPQTQQPQARGGPAPFGNQFALPSMVPPAGAGGMDPATTMQMMQNPMMRQMMQRMLSNPAMFDQMVASNPMLRSMMDSNPQLRTMMQDPTFLNFLTDPNAMSSILSMQQPSGGPSGATNPAPVLPFAFPPAGANPWVAPSNPWAPPTNVPQTNPWASAPTGDGASTTSSPQQQQQPNPFATLFPGVATATPAMPFPSPSQQPPSQPQQDMRTRFSVQLQQLVSMGFVDEERNLNALTSTNGDINAAIERLLQ